MIVLSAFPPTLGAGQDQLLTKMANDKPVVIPVLGRPGFSLGCLYDLSTHTVYVRKLWNEEELEDEKLTIADQTYSDQSIEITNSQDDRVSDLTVDASIKLDISAGAVVVEGSARYVNEANSSSQVCSMTYTSKETTITKKLNQSHLANVTYQDMLDREKHATHVVSSITYGKNAHFK